eukprot:TRINITY_DN22188_c0_g1_i2.p1 TRINITY_DN22188_c0_g1~~TRINITY_DN22188_c0_g1_i2.p1  ORF type:complete len:249 (+),score=43.20 TRINITY_DN22188_c0_g1_i2:68-748(+)
MEVVEGGIAALSETDKPFKQGFRFPAVKRIRTLRVRSEHLANAPNQLSELPVFLTHSTDEFRCCATMQLNPNTDVVLEIGCSNGAGTEALCRKHPAAYIAVDLSQEHLSLCRKRCFPAFADFLSVVYFDVFTSSFDNLFSMQFLQTGQRQDKENPDEQAREKHEGDTRENLRAEDVTMLLIDIGGDRNGEAVRRALEICVAGLPSLQCVVIKSEELVEATFKRSSH